MDVYTVEKTPTATGTEWTVFEDGLAVFATPFERKARQMVRDRNAQTGREPRRRHDEEQDDD